MGASAATMSPPPETDELHSKTVALAEDSVKMNKLFYEIAQKTRGAGRINCKTKISVNNLLAYFKDSPDSTLKSLAKNQQIFLEAHKHVSMAQKQKKGEKDSHFAEQVSKKQFHKLLATIYLFSHMWDIFAILDSDVGDKRLSKTEYLTGKNQMSEIPGVEFLNDVSDEDYEKEFTALDKDGNGYISYEEFCLYTVEKIIKPEKFLTGKNDDNEEEDDPNLVFESAADAVAAMEAKEKHQRAVEQNNEEVENGKASSQRLATVGDELAGFLRRINQEQSYQSYKKRNNVVSTKQ